ncbi:hypothetical protein PENSPDRAFT_759992 [Peniophora sp. CONT]|nr:hypothetical protein PENSPDRAFT_759992 [Peniophora sp. CONT]
MVKESSDTLRVWVEGALTRRLQEIDEDVRSTHDNGSSLAVIDENYAEDIVYLRGLIPQYARRFNRIRSPLLRLPPEILPEILNAAVSEPYFLSRWLRYGHICHDLRTALLGMRALWAEVVFNSRYIHVQEELLRRAGSSPVAIHIHSSSTSKTMDMALKLLARARGISVQYLTWRDTSRITQSLTQGKFPSLRELRLYVDNANVPEFLEGPSLDQNELVAPNLRVLVLHDMILPVNPSGLTSLSLSSSATDTPFQNALSFTHMLRRCNNLESLALSDCIPECTVLTNLPLDEQPITLPRLSQLRISQDQSRILQLWSFMKIPVSASLDVSFSEQEPCDLGRLLLSGRALRAFITHILAAKITTLYLDVEDDTVELLLGPSIPRSPHVISSRDIQTSSTFRFSTAAELETLCDIATFLECICTSLQLRADEIDTLEYSICSDFLSKFDEEHPEGRSLYAIFPAVTTLLLDTTAVDIAYVLRTTSWQGLDFFPRLKVLHVELYNDDPTQQLRDLRDAIKFRVTDHASPLRFLKIKVLYPDDEFGEEEEAQFIQELQALVQHVEIDFRH